MVDCRICGDKTHHRYVFCDECARMVYEYIANGSFEMFIKHPELYELADPSHDLAGGEEDAYNHELYETHEANAVAYEDYDNDDDYYDACDNFTDYYVSEFGPYWDYEYEVLYRLWYANYLFGYIKKTTFNDWNDPIGYHTTSQTINNLYGRCGVQRPVKIPDDIAAYIIDEYINERKSTYDLEYEFQASHGISRNHITALLKKAGVLRPPNCTRRILHKNRKESGDYYGFMNDTYYR